MGLYSPHGDHCSSLAVTCLQPNVQAAVRGIYHQSGGVAGPVTSQRSPLPVQRRSGAAPSSILTQPRTMNVATHTRGPTTITDSTADESSARKYAAHRHTLQEPHKAPPSHPQNRTPRTHRGPLNTCRHPPYGLDSVFDTLSSFPRSLICILKHLWHGYSHACAMNLARKMSLLLLLLFIGTLGCY